MASRVLTIVALVAGVGTGTTLALLQRPGASVKPKVEPRAAVAASSRALPGVAAVRSSALPHSAAPVAPAARPWSDRTHPQSAPMPYDLSPPPDVQTLRAAELSCGGADIARDCVRAAAAFQAGALVPKNERKAGIYNHRALSLYDLACRRREPEGCYALAWLHANGRGVKQSGEVAVGFFAQTLELCRERFQPICERLGEKPK
jgi:TPR repeat protein